MAKNINDEVFDEATLTKLEIFKKCFKEWLPVFIYSDFIEKIYVYDFFAGSGKDIKNNFGSPLILLDTAKGDNLKYCSQIRKNGKEVCFVFNENEPTKKSQDKYLLLENNVGSFLKKCYSENCKEGNCVYTTYFTNKTFKEGFNCIETDFHNILRNRNYAKFILLDQYGFSQVDEDVFQTLVKSPRTDFIFFISSSFIRRFKEHSNTKKYIDTKKINFEEQNPNECHIAIANYFEDLISPKIEYYINHFTIKKGSNYYGLIFGTNHTLGMEKFLKVCWELDRQAGESNCNTRIDFEKSSLFGGLETNKVEDLKRDLRKLIKEGTIKDNISGLKYALKKRCLPIFFTELIKQLEKEEKIERIGGKSYISSNIHKIKQNSKDYYQIKIKNPW